MDPKPFLTLEQQLDLLESRGLTISNRASAMDILANVNYYRFSAYSLTLRSNNVFYADITFEDIYLLYNLDAKIRSFILKYSSIIETTLRARIAYVHSKNHGALGYMDNSFFQDKWLHAQFLNKIHNLLDSSKEAFISHHRNDLGGVYPFWVVVEVMSFDVASKCLQNMSTPDQSEIAKLYHLRNQFFVNWTKCAVIARNIAAHCGRLYNRPISIKPVIPKKLSGKIRSDRAFAYLYAMYQLLSDDEKQLFVIDFKKILADYSKADFRYIGLPENWEAILSAEI